MGDLAINRLNLEAEFVGFLRRLFLRKGFEFIDENMNLARARRYEPDLLLDSHGPQGRVVIELKLYDYDHAPPELLRRAVDFVARAMPEVSAGRGIVIVTSELSPRSMQTPLPGQVEIWDIHKLVAETEGHADLLADLSELLRETQVGALGGGVLPPGLADLLETITPAAPLSEAEEIINALAQLQPGRENATKFEEACERAIQHLYGDSFGGWRSQWRIEAGFHRLDCVARLTPTAGFWATMATDFRSRYVIFEFKNYTDPISQDQIYTTEKYLFTAALRSIAIIVARNGANDSAKRAMKGALREQGKLILCLSLEDLVGLLKKSELGDDPTRLLTQRLDDLLLDITR
jgi:hypothetical protein